VRSPVQCPGQETESWEHAWTKGAIAPRGWSQPFPWHPAVTAPGRQKISKKSCLVISEDEEFFPRKERQVPR